MKRLQLTLRLRRVAGHKQGEDSKYVRRCTVKLRVDKFTLPLNPESKVLGSVVWQPIICHRTGLTLRGLTQDKHNICCAKQIQKKILQAEEDEVLRPQFSRLHFYCIIKCMPGSEDIYNCVDLLQRCTNQIIVQLPYNM